MARIQIGGEWVDLVEYTEGTTTAPAFGVSLVGGGLVTTPISYEGGTYLPVGLSYRETYHVNMTLDNVSGTVGYMLIDLDGTANWPHTETGHIILQQVIVNSNTNAQFVGDLEFGFLTNVDADNGDFNKIGELHGERNSTVGQGAFDFSSFGFSLEEDEWFGPTDENDTLFQNDVGLIGPDGGTTYVSGDGDFVLKLESSAGAADIAVTVIYTTAP